jgi:hypothetical protein
MLGCCPHCEGRLRAREWHATIIGRSAPPPSQSGESWQPQAVIFTRVIIFTIPSVRLDFNATEVR